MRAFKSFVVFAFLYGASLQTQGQTCDAIIQHGLRNVSTAYSQDTATSLRYFNHCQKNLDTLDSSKMADAEVEIFGQGRGGGSYSETQRRTALQEWCTTNRDTAFRNQTSFQNAQSIYQGAVDAWSKCNSLKSKSIQVTPVISPDNETVDIGVVYTGNTSSGIRLNGVKAEGFACDVTRPDNKKIKYPEEILNLTFNVQCKRSAATKELSGGESYQRKARGVITIQTSSEPVQFFFAEEFNPPLPVAQARRILEALPRVEAPIGTVIASALTEEQFYSPNNPQADKSKWLLADGRQLPPGTAFEKITGQKAAPDLRWAREASVVVASVSRSGKHGENLKGFETDGGKVGSWLWMVGLRDVSGQRVNNDYEQDVDHFQAFNDQNGVITAQGRTLNWKHSAWGPWKPGEANVFGLFLRKQDHVRHFIKIN